MRTEQYNCDLTNPNITLDNGIKFYTTCCIKDMQQNNSTRKKFMAKGTIEHEGMPYEFDLTCFMDKK